MGMPNRMLILARISAWALNHLTREYDMGTLAHTFVGDRLGDWAEGSGHVKALINGKSVAECYPDTMVINGTLPKTIGVLIPSIYGIIRPKALSNFDPELFNIYPNNTTNWMGDSPPDLEVNITIEDAESMIPGLLGPMRVIPQQPTTRKPKVIGSISGSRH